MFNVEITRYAVKPFIQCIRHADFDCDDFFPTAARIVWNNLSENIEPRRAQMLYRSINFDFLTFYIKKSRF